MKNLDIEKLERRNIYTVPDNFFEQVQQNVLQNTIQQPQISAANIRGNISKNWWYAAAAAVALIFGSTYYLTANQQEGTQIAQQQATEVEEQTYKPALTQPIPAENEVEPLKDLTFQAKADQTHKKTIAVIKKETPKDGIKKEISLKTKPDQQVDQILQSFSEEEIASLATNSNQDIYLDLYN